MVVVFGELTRPRGFCSRCLSSDPGSQRRVPDKDDGAAAGQAFYDGGYQHQEEPGQD